MHFASIENEIGRGFVWEWRMLVSRNGGAPHWELLQSVHIYLNRCNKWPDSHNIWVEPHNRLNIMTRQCLKIATCQYRYRWATAHNLYVELWPSQKNSIEYVPLELFCAFGCILQTHRIGSPQIEYLESRKYTSPYWEMDEFSGALKEEEKEGLFDKNGNFSW